MFSNSPFWFANNELLTELLRNEIRLLNELFASCPDLRSFFDFPEADEQQRAACFSALAHRTLMDEIYETFAGRYEQSPSLGDEEKFAIEHTQNLFAADAPGWVLELNEVAQRFPARIYDALPEPLRRSGFYAADPAQTELIHATAKELSNAQKIQTLIESIFDEQLKRLQRRWSADRPATKVIREIIMQKQESKKTKGSRTRDKQRILRDKAIVAIDDVAQDIYEFLKIMDERKIRPQPTWSEWPGSWREAYKNTHLRELIHKDKSRALARIRRQRSK